MSVLEYSMMLVLASNSPRRKQLLALGGWEFIVHAVDLDERVLPGEAPDAYVRRLAQEKALAAARLPQVQRLPDAQVLAADTAVVDWAMRDGPAKILGKPVDARQAHAMLCDLRAREHQVLSGVAVLRLRDMRLLSDVCVTRVQMRDYSDDEIWAYIESGDPMDKAGAYAIQHSGFHPVEHLSGCFANVAGLPLCRLHRLLEAQDVSLPSDITCQCEQQAEQRPDQPCRVYLQAFEGA